MPQLIPFQAGEDYAADYEFSAKIEGDLYWFVCHWNRRDSSWYFNLLEFDRTPILHSVHLVLGVYLGMRSSHPLFTRGALVAIDLAQSEQIAPREAGYRDLGSRVVVRWYTAEECAAGLGFGVVG